MVWNQPFTTCCYTCEQLYLMTKCIFSYSENALQGLMKVYFLQTYIVQNYAAETHQAP